MNNPNSSPEMARARYEHMVKRLGDELDRLIKMAAWMRESLENELFNGMGYKQLALTKVDIDRMREVTRIFESVTDTKVKYDRAQKQFADNMTPAEELAAVITYIKATTPENRRAIMEVVRAWQAEKPGTGRNGRVSAPSEGE